MSGSAPGKGQTELAPEAFGRLLGWLDPDVERAGHKYEQIRRGLIKIFRCKGCQAPEELADRAIDRVTGKIRDVANGFVGEPASYFYSVADMIYMEHLRTAAQLNPLPAQLAAGKNAGSEIELKYECLEDCMGRLPEPSRGLIRDYYDERWKGRAKARKKRELARHMGIATNMLWLKVHRIRAGLKKCVEQCVQNKETETGLKQ
jgi:DNA-directed RNA polymerase specialized sigma24 family protein